MKADSGDFPQTLSPGERDLPDHSPEGHPQNPRNLPGASPSFTFFARSPRPPCRVGRIRGRRPGRWGGRIEESSNPSRLTSRCSPAFLWDYRQCSRRLPDPLPVRREGGLPLAHPNFVCRVRLSERHNGHVLIRLRQVRLRLRESGAGLLCSAPPLVLVARGGGRLCARGARLLRAGGGRFDGAG